MSIQSVLVVEDNEKNMKLARVLLQMGDYRVLEAVDAEKGIEIARTDRPDLILMDIQPPCLSRQTHSCAIFRWWR